MNIPLDFVTSFMFENFENVKVTKNGEHFLCRCPICGDSKKSKQKRRFNLDYENGLIKWKCFNCDRSGNFFDIYGRIYALTPEESYEKLRKNFGTYNSTHLKNKLVKNEIRHVKNDVFYDFEPLIKDIIDENTKPKSLQQKEFQKALIDFRTKRSIPQDIRLFVAHAGPYRGRIIIPVYENKQIVYFQGRAIHSTNPIKYKNPPLKKEDIILNKDRFDRSKYIIVSEGLLDAFAVGAQGTCILGKSLTDEFIEKLFSLTDVGVILALDNDSSGIASTLKFIKESRNSKRVRYFIYPNKIKDINDLTKLDIINIYDFIISNSHTREKWYSYIKFNGGNTL